MLERSLRNRSALQGLPKSCLCLVPQVVLLFPWQFWPKDADMFGRVAETTAERGDFFLFYSYADLAGVLLESARNRGLFLRMWCQERRPRCAAC